MRRDVGGGEASLKTLDVDHDTVLTGYTGHTTGDTLEVAIGDTHQIVGHETTLTDVDLHDMLIAQGSGADQRLHVAGRDRKRGILSIGIEMEMVVIVSGETGLDRLTDIVVGLLRGDIGKEEVHERHQYALLSAILAPLVLPDHGQIGIIA